MRIYIYIRSKWGGGGLRTWNFLGYCRKYHPEILEFNRKRSAISVGDQRVLNNFTEFPSVKLF